MLIAKLAGAAGLAAFSCVCWRYTPEAWLRDYGDGRLLFPSRSRRGGGRLFAFFALFFAASALPCAGAVSGAAAAPLFCLLQLCAADIRARVLPDEWIALILLAGARSPAGILPLVLLPLPLGCGDVKLLCALGFVLGAEALLFLAASAFLLAALYAALLLLGGAGRKETFPFAPFLLLAYLIVKKPEKFRLRHGKTGKIHSEAQSVFILRTFVRASLTHRAPACIIVAERERFPDFL